MKLEELLAPCPKCGSKDKITVKCEECGYIFFVNDDMEEDEKKKLLNELNKIHG